MMTFLVGCKLYVETYNPPKILNFLIKWILNNNLDKPANCNLLLLYIFLKLIVNINFVPLIKPLKFLINASHS